MSVLFVAVPVAVLLACAGVMAFLWAARHGQLDDLDTPPLRMLLDDEAAAKAAGARDVVEKPVSRLQGQVGKRAQL